MARNFNFRDSEFQSYSMALGELVLVWNDLHMTLASLFWTASRIPNGLIANAMWNSQSSDRAQRKLLDSIITLDVSGQIIRGKMQVELMWLLKEVEKIEELRNNALHSPFFKDVNGNVFPWHQLGNKLAKKLAKKNPLTEFRWFYDTAIVLRDYAEVLGEAIHQTENQPLIRPRLPSRATTL